MNEVLSITRSLMKQMVHIDVRSKNIEKVVTSLQNRNFDDQESTSSLSKIKELRLPVESLKRMIELNEELSNEDFFQNLVCNKNTRFNCI